MRSFSGHKRPCQVVSISFAEVHAATERSHSQDTCLRSALQAPRWPRFTIIPTLSLSRQAAAVMQRLGRPYGVRFQRPPLHPLLATMNSIGSEPAGSGWPSPRFVARAQAQSGLWLSPQLHLASAVCRLYQLLASSLYGTQQATFSAYALQYDWFREGQIALPCVPSGRALTACSSGELLVQVLSETSPVAT
jgi:hypothetical protein